MLTNKYDYDILIGSNSKWKLQRTMTELGICDQFNSKLSELFAMDFLINDHIPPEQLLYEVNYFDSDPYIVLNNLHDSDVIYLFFLRILFLGRILWDFFVCFLFNFS